MAAYVSKVNDSPFCIGAHTATAARAYQDPERVTAVLADLDSTPIEEGLRATLGMLGKLTRLGTLSADDIRAVLSAGVSHSRSRTRSRLASPSTRPTASRTRSPSRCSVRKASRRTRNISSSAATIKRSSLDRRRGGAANRRDTRRRGPGRAGGRDGQSGRPPPGPRGSPCRDRDPASVLHRAVGRREAPRGPVPTTFSSISSRFIASPSQFGGTSADQCGTTPLPGAAYPTLMAAALPVAEESGRAGTVTGKGVKEQP
jgi:AhpD family alkylhydroperoxidase